jgi:hypothetical protein
VLSKGKTPERFAEESPQSRPLVDTALARVGRKSADVLILPLYIKQRNLAVIVGAESAKVIEVVLID